MMSRAPAVVPGEQDILVVKSSDSKNPHFKIKKGHFPASHCTFLCLQFLICKVMTLSRAKRFTWDSTWDKVSLCAHIHTHKYTHTSFIFPVVFAAPFTDVPSRILKIREKGRSFRLDSQPTGGWQWSVGGLDGRGWAGYTSYTRKERGGGQGTRKRKNRGSTDCLSCFSR